MNTSPGPDALDLPVVGARRRARERALGLLYEAEAKGQPLERIVADLPVSPEPYALVLVEGVASRLAEIDETISLYPRDWAIDRMPAVDRQLLRVGVFELIGRVEVPVAVVIDEAVELAKQYSTEESSRFVNGVLAAVAVAALRGGRVVSYADAGVDYETLDDAKRLALATARTTAALGAARGAPLDARFFGEPAALFALGPERLGFVLECLGTKSMLASAYLELTGEDRFSSIGYDTVAAAVNDCCCIGALPVVANAYFATGAASFYVGSRHRSLIEGFARACVDSGASWAGGESPTLSGLVAEREVDLAAAVVGLVPDGVAPLAAERLVPGDEIVLVGSSGLHTNGASLARRVAEGLPGGLLEPLPSGRTFGDALLDESLIYVPLLDALLHRVPDLHYASHITGHGLRKLMRAERELTYRIFQLPEVPEVLNFLAAAAGMDVREAYGTFNMGAGFALYVGAGAGAAVVDIAGELGYRGIVAGAVEPGERQVILEPPVGCTYTSEELELR